MAPQNDVLADDRTDDPVDALAIALNRAVLDHSTASHFVAAIHIPINGHSPELNDALQELLPPKNGVTFTIIVQNDAGALDSIRVVSEDFVAFETALDTLGQNAERLKEALGIWAPPAPTVDPETQAERASKGRER